jgi:hypothetical protein
MDMMRLVGDDLLGYCDLSNCNSLGAWWSEGHSHTPAS